METVDPMAQTASPSLDVMRNNVAFENQFEKVFREFFQQLQLTDEEVTTNTPKRFLKALREMTEGYKQDPVDFLSVTFKSESQDLVIIKDIPFSSLCEHHLMPFWGVAHIGYIPFNEVAGLSKFPRAVQALARRLQIQERLTKEIRTAIEMALSPIGTAVVISSTHSCMRCRGVKSTGEMTTSSLSGVLKTSDAARAEFFSLLGNI